MGGFLSIPFLPLGRGVIGFKPLVGLSARASSKKVFCFVV
jgi:hypothetical protein